MTFLSALRAWVTRLIAQIEGFIKNETEPPVEKKVPRGTPPHERDKDVEI